MPDSLLRLLAITVLVSAAASELHGQEILILGLNGDLHSVEPNSGQVSFIGTTGAHNYFWSAMAQDSQGRLFAATGAYYQAFSIYELDPQTGVGTFIVQTNLYGVVCMAFDSGDTLYIGNDRTAPLYPSPMDLYTVDLGTGGETLVGDTGVNNMLAMDFDQGVLYGYPYDLGLVTIDTVSGLATDVNPAFRGPNGSTVSMCFDDRGALYYIDDLVWMMDSETGVASVIDWTSPFGFWAEAVFVEGPTSKFSLWFSGTAGGPMRVKISGATPGGPVGIAMTRWGAGSSPIPGGFQCAGTIMSLNGSMELLQVATANATGNAAIGPQLVPSGAVGRVRLQAIDLSTCTVSNRAILSY